MQQSGADFTCNLQAELRESGSDVVQVLLDTCGARWGSEAFSHGQKRSLISARAEHEGAVTRHRDHHTTSPGLCSGVKKEKSQRNLQHVYLPSHMQPLGKCLDMFRGPVHISKQIKCSLNTAHMLPIKLCVHSHKKEDVATLYYTGVWL